MNEITAAHATTLDPSADAPIQVARNEPRASGFAGSRDPLEQRDTSDTSEHESVNEVEARIIDACEEFARAVREGDYIAVGRAGREAIQAGAAPTDYTDALAEAIASGDAGLLSTMLGVLGMERVQNSAPDFLLWSLIADSDSETPSAFAFFVQHSGLLYRPKRRKKKAASAEAALATTGVSPAPSEVLDTAEEQAATPGSVAAFAELLARSPDESEADTVRVDAWIAFDDYLLDAILAISPAGVSIVEIREAIIAMERAEREAEAQSADDARDAIDEDLLAIGSQSAARMTARERAREAIAARRGQANRRAAKVSAERFGEEGDSRGLTPGQALRARAHAASASGAIGAIAQNRALIRGGGLQLLTAGRARGTFAGAAFATAPSLVSLYGSPAAMSAMLAGVAGFPAASTIDGVSGVTPLHLAALSGNLEAVRELLAQGADPEAMSSMGARPLELATAYPDVFQVIEEAIEQAPLREARQLLELEELEREERASLRAERRVAHERAPSNTQPLEASESHYGGRDAASRARGPSMR